MGDRTRARSADRDRAVEIINAAYADGQLGEIVRENRIESALHATTLAQLRALTQDLQAPAPPPPVLTRGERLRERAGRLSPGARLAATWVAVLVVLGGTVAFFGTGSDPVQEREEALAFAMTAEAMEELRDSYEAQFQTTQTYLAHLGPAGVVVHVPTPDGKERYEAWEWRSGEFVKVADARTASMQEATIDLADVDFARMATHVERAEGGVGVEDPEEVSVWIEHPSYEEAPVVRIQVTNEYDELGYLFTDLAGAEVRRQVFGEE